MPSFQPYDEFFWPTIDVPEELAPQEAVYESPLGSQNFTLSGSAIDSVGSPYVGAIVKLFRKGDDSKVSETTSDGSGSWTFTLAENAGTFYVVAFDTTGSPMGVTTNTLVAV